MRKRILRKCDSIPYESIEIFERDGWRCHICGKLTLKNKKVPHHRTPTLDHIIPLFEGGADAPHNVRCAHFRCNAIKGAKILPQGEQLLLL